MRLLFSKKRRHISSCLKKCSFLKTCTSFLFFFFWQKNAHFNRCANHFWFSEEMLAPVMLESIKSIKDPITNQTRINVYRSITENSAIKYFVPHSHRFFSTSQIQKSPDLLFQNDVRFLVVSKKTRVVSRTLISFGRGKTNNLFHTLSFLSDEGKKLR